MWVAEMARGARTSSAGATSRCGGARATRRPAPGWREGLHSDDRDRVVARARRSLGASARVRDASTASGTPTATTGRSSSTGSRYFAANGALDGFVGTDVDITDQLRAERERTRGRRRCSTPRWRPPPSASGFVDADLRYVRVNKTLAEFHEVPAEDHVGKTIDEVIGTRGVDLAEHYVAVLESGQPVTGDRDGPRLRPAPVATSPTTTRCASSGDIVGVGIVTIDITERRNLEAQFLQAQKLEAVGRLAGGVAHDFNNLLGVMSGYADLIAAQLARGRTSCSAHALEIARAAVRGADLTRRLLAFSRDQRAGRGERRPARRPRRSRPPARAARAGLRRAPGRDRTDPAVVHVDVSRLGQVIVNLVVNAVDAMPRRRGPRDTARKSTATRVR